MPIADLHLPLALQLITCGGDRQDREEGEGCGTQEPSPRPVLPQVPTSWADPTPQVPGQALRAARAVPSSPVTYPVSNAHRDARTTETHWPEAKGTERGSRPDPWSPTSIPALRGNHLGPRWPRLHQPPFTHLPPPQNLNHSYIQPKLGPPPSLWPGGSLSPAPHLARPHLLCSGHGATPAERHPQSSPSILSQWEQKQVWGLHLPPRQPERNHPGVAMETVSSATPGRRQRDGRGDRGPDGMPRASKGLRGPSMGGWGWAVSQDHSHRKRGTQAGEGTCQKSHVWHSGGGLQLNANSADIGVPGGPASSAPHRPLSPQP